MDILAQIITSMMLFATGLLGAGDVAPQQAVGVLENIQTVEIGIRELSPRGETGGFAMPASGCGVVSHGPEHDCDPSLPIITVNTGIVRIGDPVVITWDPNENTNCVLSSNLADLGPTLNQGNDPPDGTVADSAEDTPTGETTYGITCDGVGNESYVSVKVLPEIQET